VVKKSIAIVAPILCETNIAMSLKIMNVKSISIVVAVLLATIFLLFLLSADIHRMK